MMHSVNTLNLIGGVHCWTPAHCYRPSVVFQLGGVPLNNNNNFLRKLAEKRNIPLRLGFGLKCFLCIIHGSVSIKALVLDDFWEFVLPFHRPNRH